MSKRTPMDKQQVRERRNRLLESAAAAELSLTQGVREMRAIAGMTQEEFARHRGVSARVIKTIETGQANPTVATLNQIGRFFGLEVGFVPTRRASAAEGHSALTSALPVPLTPENTGSSHLAGELHAVTQLMRPDGDALGNLRHYLSEARTILDRLHREIAETSSAVAPEAPSSGKPAITAEAGKRHASKKRKSN